jgi:drug/metabolite transporter (DMT)-like permease
VESIPTLTAGAWTYLAAGLALLPWAIQAGGMNFRKPLITIGWILAGSVFGPSLYFIGLRLLSGTEGVLLISREAVFTARLAFMFFKEKFTKGTFWASVLILSGAVWMSLSGNSLLSNRGSTRGYHFIMWFFKSKTRDNNESIIILGKSLT